MSPRLVHLATYTAGYGLVLLLERVQARLDEQAARERAAALERAVCEAVQVARLEAELEAFDATDVLERHAVRLEVDFEELRRG